MELPHLASPARRALAAAHITSLEDLSRVTFQELAALHGMGPHALKTLQAALQKHGLTFLQEK